MGKVVSYCNATNLTQCNTFTFFIFYFFLNHMFIVPMVQEMTCILLIWPKQNRKSDNHQQRKYL